MLLSTRFVGLLGRVKSPVTGYSIFAAICVVLPHLAAAAIMFWYEVTIYSMAVFVLTWALLNFVWLVVLRRAAVAAALSLVMIAMVVALSELKFATLWLQLSFVDLMIVDVDSAEYVLATMPWVSWAAAAIAAIVLPLLFLIWRADTVPVRRPIAFAGFAACLVGVSALCSSVELDPLEGYHGNKYVSFFTRSTVFSIAELTSRGMLESDVTIPDRLNAEIDVACATAAKPPHIILVHDESSFDIRSAPGIKVPPQYGEHFKSFDGKQRRLLVEGIGGPSWYAEYSVLTGLSPRSFGRFSYFAMRIASGRVVRGLPNALRRCGYQTRTIYSALGAFMSERSFHNSVGVQKFRDQNDMRAEEFEPDVFYYNKALGALTRDREKGPMFLYIYLAANHYPWYERWRSDLMPQWQDLQDPPLPLVDEYIRRQTISAQYFTAFKTKLAEKFPDESFLLVRYGDHQPDFSTSILEPWLDPAEIARRVGNFDPKYFTTYYAIDAINFKPVDLSSAADTLDGPYLPLVIQEAAGLPLDPSFAEQKNILQRCAGIFYACNGGAEARRFNRLLIEAGLIRQL
jgi:phosphoglycerol transferase MdoB-like AlkP superfamily enzyme